MTDDKMPPLPEPVGYRSRYRSEPGMIGHYPWTYADQRRRKYDRPECEYEDLFTADQLRAAVAAERERWRDVRRLALRALVAWDETVLPQANDGMMQECMEDLRAAVLLPASVSQQPCQTTQERT